MHSCNSLYVHRQKLLSCAAKIVASFTIIISQNLWPTSESSIGVGQVSMPDAVETIGAGRGASSSVIVNFPIGAFGTTPAVFILPDSTNPDPMTFRVHSVSTTSFEVNVALKRAKTTTGTIADSGEDIAYWRSF